MGGLACAHRVLGRLCSRPGGPRRRGRREQQRPARGQPHRHLLEVSRFSCRSADWPWATLIDLRRRRFDRILSLVKLYRLCIGYGIAVDDPGALTAGLPGIASLHKYLDIRRQDK